MFKSLPFWQIKIFKILNYLLPHIVIQLTQKNLIGIKHHQHPIIQSIMLY